MTAGQTCLAEPKEDTETGRDVSEKAYIAVDGIRRKEERNIGKGQTAIYKKRKS